jgi:hypothetical protein
MRNAKKRRRVEQMRADLRLSDLAEREIAPTKLMNVKIPDSVSDGIDQVADELSCSKTAAVVALLNEGLNAFASRSEQLRATPGRKQMRRGRRPKVNRRRSA